jgi:hypothetical protein
LVVSVASTCLCCMWFRALAWIIDNGIQKKMSPKCPVSHSSSIIENVDRSHTIWVDVRRITGYKGMVGSDNSQEILAFDPLRVYVCFTHSHYLTAPPF